MKSKRIDRIFPAPVGRIVRSSGTSHAPTFRRINDSLTVCWERGRVDLLEAVRDGVISPMQLHAAVSTGRIDRLPMADDLVPLREAWTTWREQYDCSDRYRESLGQSLRYLLAEGKGDPAVSALPKLLGKHRTRMQKASHPRTFNMTRSAVQAFARSTRGKQSPLWRDVSAVEPLLAPRTRRGHPLTVAAFFELLDALPAPARMDARMMALTGMGPTEYYRDGWETYPERVHIFGQKRAGRDRDVPNAVSGYVPSEPWGSYRTLREALSDATNGAVQPYDLRRSFATWMEAAGIPRTRRRGYLGHGEADITDRYEAHDVTAYLAADSLTLREYLVTAMKVQRADAPNGDRTADEVPHFLTHAPPRNRTENLLIKSRLGDVQVPDDLPQD